MQTLITAAVVEWRAKLYTPARRLFEAAIREAAACGVLAMQFVAWTWADCELQQGRAAMATEVLNRALHTCKTPALILLLAKVRAIARAGKNIEKDIGWPPPWRHCAAADLHACLTLNRCCEGRSRSSFEVRGACRLS